MWKGGGGFGGARLGGGVDGPANLYDDRGDVIDRGFGSAPFDVEGCVPSCFIRCFLYPSSSARYTQVASNPYFAVPVMMRLMFWARIFFCLEVGRPICVCCRTTL